MSRGLAKVFGILVATELVALAVVVAIVLHGDQRTEFPASVPINAPTAVATRSSVPVSVTLKMVGATATAALRPGGGQAQTVSPSSERLCRESLERHDDGPRSAATPPVPIPAAIASYA